MADSPSLMPAMMLSSHPLTAFDSQQGHNELTV
jgi:hypothetical protein